MITHWNTRDNHGSKGARNTLLCHFGLVFRFSTGTSKRCGYHHYSVSTGLFHVSCFFTPSQNTETVKSAKWKENTYPSGNQTQTSSTISIEFCTIPLHEKRCFRSQQFYVPLLPLVLPNARRISLCVTTKYGGCRLSILCQRWE